MTPAPSEEIPVASRRTLEIWTAAAAGLTGAIVTVESLSHDIGWNETGPGSGYFPFRVGLLLIGVAIVRVLQVVTVEARLKPGPTTDTEARLKPGPTTAFVTREELGRSLSVFWPTAALVVAMYPLGCYVPSLVYLAWMMRRHGGYHWGKSVAFAAAVMVAFFLIFELWFSVPLAKGPLEAALGLY
jgi:putative tricarboxylic transport membrane protein